MAVADNSANSVARLSRRLDCNQAHSGAFAEFVHETLAVDADDEVLDLGPGLGAQLLPAAARARRAVGVEVSPEMVATVRARAHRNVEVIGGDMDDLAGLHLAAPFSLAYAVYSLHYSRDPARVVRSVATLLAGPRARLVVVTPDRANNREWFADLGRLYEVSPAVLEVAQVGRGVVLPALRRVCARVTCTTLQMQVRFAALDALMDYYDACAPYCRPDRRDQARRYFAARFDRDGGYEIDKHSLAMVGYLETSSASLRA